MEVLDTAHALATEYLHSLEERRVTPVASAAVLRASLGKPLNAAPLDGSLVLRQLAADAERGFVATAGGRYFGFVIGGALPVAIAADWLTSAWDQHGTFFVSSPAASVVEEVVASWLIELFRLPAHASCGLVTGCQMANFSALAAARHEVLRRAGWDVERRGLRAAPAITVLVGADAHITIFAALRMLGMGSGEVRVITADDQGRMSASSLAQAVAETEGPLIVCAQAGNVNSGAFDPIDEIATAVHARGGWLHVDGAFGMWARASSRYERLAIGLENADSWATDAHKWLNVPYDCGLVFTAHPAAHRAALTLDAAYLQKSAGEERDGVDWVPEVSRRARGFVLYATLRALGRDGVANLIETSCERAAQLADLISADPRFEVLNDVVLNQVLLTLGGSDSDRWVREAVARIQAEGEIWLGLTTWRGRVAMRVSVSSWMTSSQDIARAAAAIRRAVDAAGVSRASEASR